MSATPSLVMWRRGHPLVPMCARSIRHHFSSTGKLPSTSFQPYPLAVPRPPPLQQRSGDAVVSVPESQVTTVHFPLPTATAHEGQPSQDASRASASSVTVTRTELPPRRTTALPTSTATSASSSTPRTTREAAAAAQYAGIDTGRATSVSSSAATTTSATATTTTLPTPPTPSTTTSESPRSSSNPTAAAAAVAPVQPAAAQPQPKPRSRLRTPRKAAMTLTPAAVLRLKTLMDQPELNLIKVGVRNRGCSGLAYHLEYVDKAGPFDEMVEQDGVRVIIDSRALFSIIGSEMDWHEDQLSQGFVFRNPNIKEQCGCGESFMV